MSSGHEYVGPKNPNAIPPGWERTKNTEEQFAIRELILNRGVGFTLALFYGTVIGLAELQEIYMGRPIPLTAAKVLKSVLKERMTLT